MQPQPSSSTCALVIEDDAALRSAICGTLEDAGFDARAASSVDEARAAASRVHPDVVVFDLLLGGEFGERLLIDLLHTSNPPAIVICSAFALAHLIAARHEVSFVPKPFDLSGLVSVVEDAVAQRSSA